MGMVATLVAHEGDHQRGWKRLFTGHAGRDQGGVILGGVCARHVLLPRHGKTPGPLRRSDSGRSRLQALRWPSVGVVMAGLASRGRAKAGGYYDAGSVTFNILLV
jgi:hypothetical protein